MKKRIVKQIYLFLYLLIKQTINRIMNLREKVNALFAKHNVSLSAEEVVEVKQMVEAILEDGTSIYSDSDTWAAGVRVFGKDAEGNEVVLADGEYKTAESIIVVVADGVVTELKPMEEEAPEVEVVIEEEQTSEVVAEESLSAEVEGLLSLVAKLESELSEIKKANENLSSEVTKLSAQPAASSIKEVKQAKQTPSKPYAKMSAEERYLFNLKK
jgi:DNA repair exonuclease SbcCD ATPase subunit